MTGSLCNTKGTELGSVEKWELKSRAQVKTVSPDNTMMTGALPLPNDRPEPVPLTEEEQRLKKKHSLEAAVTVGLGYGKKKKHAVEAFYTAIWPVLEGAGWKVVRLDMVVIIGAEICYSLCGL